MRQQIEKKLQGMLNKTFKYGIRIITITGYEINEAKERVYIHTNEKDNHWDRPFDAIMSFCKEFEPTELKVASKSGSETDTMISNASTMGQQLQSVLMDNIEKVGKSKDYIPQATAINNSINSLINLKKLELDYLRTAQKLKNQ